MRKGQTEHTWWYECEVRYSGKSREREAGFDLKRRTWRMRGAAEEADEVRSGLVHCHACRIEGCGARRPCNTVSRRCLSFGARFCLWHARRCSAIKRSPALCRRRARTREPLFRHARSQRWPS